MLKAFGWKAKNRVLGFSDITLSLIEELGFDWDSSLMGRDFEPYHPRPVEIDYENGNKFGASSRILEFPVSWYLDDFPFLELCPDYGLPGATSTPMLFERWKERSIMLLSTCLMGSLFLLFILKQWAVRRTLWCLSGL